MEQPADKFVKLSSEIEKSFRCCACEKFLHPEIRMCNNGHNMCEECLLENGSSCHICHQYVEDTSNTQIEALMKQFQVAVPCKNHRSGCTEEVQIGALNLHEVECQFRDVSCVVLDCGSRIIFNQLENHMAEEHQDLEGGTWVLKKASVIKGSSISKILESKGRRSEPLIEQICSNELLFQDAMEHMVPGTEVVRGRDYWYPGHECSNSFVGGLPLPDDPVRKEDTGRVLSRYEDVHVDVTWGSSNKSYKYRMGAGGRYDLRVAESHWDFPFAIRTWRQSNTRFFATLFIGTDKLWHVWVTAATGKTAAEKFRAETRLASSHLPECSSIYYRPVDHLGSGILDSTSEKIYFSTCLSVHKNEVSKHDGGVMNALSKDMAVPFTCKVFEKVFVTLDKEDIEEKEDD